MTIIQRLKLRVDSATASDALIIDCIDVVTDRLMLRLGVSELPVIFESILVDAVVKMIRRLYYEGIASEGVSGISTSFVNDILDEYTSEIEDWKNSSENDNSKAKKVVFL